MSDDKRKVGVGDRVEFMITANDRETGQGTVCRIRQHLADIEMDNGARITAWTFHVSKVEPRKSEGD